MSEHDKDPGPSLSGPCPIGCFLPASHWAPKWDSGQGYKQKLTLDFQELRNLLGAHGITQGPPPSHASPGPPSPGISVTHALSLRDSLMNLSFWRTPRVIPTFWWKRPFSKLGDMHAGPALPQATCCRGSCQPRPGHEAQPTKPGLLRAYSPRRWGRGSDGTEDKSIDSITVMLYLLLEQGDGHSLLWDGDDHSEG